jgi:hypothetical protein
MGRTAKTERRKRLRIRRLRFLNKANSHLNTNTQGYIYFRLIKSTIGGFQRPDPLIFSLKIKSRQNKSNKDKQSEVKTR